MHTSAGALSRANLEVGRDRVPGSGLSIDHVERDTGAAMKALVVFESMFGNTERVARAVADGIRPYGATELVEVGSAPARPGGDVDLIVVGGPTHAFGMSRPRTRADAVKQAGGTVVSGRIGIREWLSSLPADPPGVAAAAFDTRVKLRGLPGSAARAAARHLRRAGHRLIAPAESFYVEGTPGPLAEGELDRARRFGERLGRTLTSPDHARSDA